MHPAVNGTLRSVIPLFGYYLVSGLVYTFCSEAWDASAQVLAVALLCLPWTLWMLASDSKQSAIKEVSPKAPGRTGPAGEGKQKEGGKVFSARHWVLPALACFAGGAALSALSSVLMRKLGVYGSFSNEAQESLQTSAAIFLLLGPGIFGPVCEEIIYRGLLHRRLRTWLPALAAAPLSAFIFAAGHGNVIQFLYAFPMGLLLAALSEAGGGNLLLPLAMHLGANLFSAIAAVL